MRPCESLFFRPQRRVLLPSLTLISSLFLDLLLLVCASLPCSQRGEVRSLPDLVRLSSKRPELSELELTRSPLLLLSQHRHHLLERPQMRHLVTSRPRTHYSFLSTLSRTRLHFHSLPSSFAFLERPRPRRDPLRLRGYPLSSLDRSNSSFPNLHLSHSYLPTYPKTSAHHSRSPSLLYLDILSSPPSRSSLPIPPRRLDLRSVHARHSYLPVWRAGEGCSATRCGEEGAEECWRGWSGAWVHRRGERESR